MTFLFSVAVTLYGVSIRIIIKYQASQRRCVEASQFASLLRLDLTLSLGSPLTDGSSSLHLIGGVFQLRVIHQPEANIHSFLTLKILCLNDYLKRIYEHQSLAEMKPFAMLNFQH